MNPFSQKNKFSSPEMKALLLQLKEVTAKICLQYAEENGEKYDDALIHQTINSQVQFTNITFKMFAESKLALQPASTLSNDDKVAIAAHEAYKRVVQVGQD